MPPIIMEEGEEELKQLAAVNGNVSLNGGGGGAVARAPEPEPHDEKE